MCISCSSARAIWFGEAKVQEVHDAPAICSASHVDTMNAQALCLFAHNTLRCKQQLKRCHPLPFDPFNR